MIICYIKNGSDPMILINHVILIIFLASDYAIIFANNHSLCDKTLRELSL